jgi:aspartate kinase
MTRRARVRVVKYGGAALAEPRRVVEEVRRRHQDGRPLVVVVSAREGVTDLLEEAIRAPRAARRHAEIVREIESAHGGLPSGGRRHLERLRRLLGEAKREGRADAPLADRVRSQGERLAAHWVSAELLRAGVPAVPVEADHLGLITDNAYGASCIVFDRSREPVRRGLGRLLARGAVPVVTGYFGRSLEGRVATLGRGGSDYAAAGIGALLGAPCVELVKRQVSVFSADPREVRGARPLRSLSYEEAEELAQFGARVLHPLTIEPARAFGVLLKVRSLERPEIVTTIGPASRTRRNRAITSLRPLRLLRLRVPGGRQRPGVVAEVSELLAAAGVNLVQLFTSSALLCLVVPPGEARRAVRALASTARETAAVLEGPLRVSLVTVIGDGVLDDVGRIPASVVRGAEGMSATPRALSLAVPEARGPEVVRSLHRALVVPGRR